MLQETEAQREEAQREEARRWAVAIAHRAAMRVLPVYRSHTLRGTSVEHTISPIAVLRARLLTGIAATQSVVPFVSVNQVSYLENKIAEDVLPDAGYTFAARSCFSSLRVISDADPATALERVAAIPIPASQEG